jgi:hypothetical protein
MTSSEHTSQAPVFQVYVGPQLAMEAPLDHPNRQPGPTIEESQQVIFAMQPLEAGLEYSIAIGDHPLPTARVFRHAVEWAQEPHFESARGRTVVTVKSRPVGNQDRAWKRRAEIEFSVVPSKLTEDEYQRMLDDLAALAAGLVYDLVSKSVARLPGPGRRKSGRLLARVGQVELRLIENTWAQLADSLTRIVIQPETSLETVRQLRACTGSENFSPKDIERLAATGIDPRSWPRNRTFGIEVLATRLSIQTLENSVVAAFLDLLVTRLRDCQARAEREIEMIEDERRFRDVFGANSLYRLVDEPRIATLQDAVKRARSLVRQILAARMELPVRAGAATLHTLPLTPVFANVPHYYAFWRLASSFMGKSAITVEWPLEERTKPTWRMYEQWIFLQILAAIWELGFQGKSHSELIELVAKGRFSIDVDRGSGVEFLADAGRSIVVRYEPRIFALRDAVEAGDLIYRGMSGEVPWAPDVLIEVRSLNKDRVLQTDYAAVVDAKYTKKLTEQHTAGVIKYAQIRSITSKESIVRQIWIAMPDADAIVPEDPGIQWTPSGPTATRSELVVGKLCVRPAPEGGLQGGEIPIANVARQFVAGLLGYCELSPAARTVSSTALAV